MRSDLLAGALALAIVAELGGGAHDTNGDLAAIGD
jgi:hypothetical protein